MKTAAEGHLEQLVIGLVSCSNWGELEAGLGCLQPALPGSARWALGA